jgi:hypothetical protein
VDQHHHRIYTTLNQQPFHKEAIYTYAGPHRFESIVSLFGFVLLISLMRRFVVTVVTVGTRDVPLQKSALVRLCIGKISASGALSLVLLMQIEMFEHHKSGLSYHYIERK